MPRIFKEVQQNAPLKMAKTKPISEVSNPILRMFCTHPGGKGKAKSHEIAIGSGERLMIKITLGKVDYFALSP